MSVAESCAINTITVIARGDPLCEHRTDQCGAINDPPHNGEVFKENTLTCLTYYIKFLKQMLNKNIVLYIMTICNTENTFLQDFQKMIKCSEFLGNPEKYVAVTIV